MKYVIFCSLKLVQKAVFWLNQVLAVAIARVDTITDLNQVDASAYYQKLKTGDL